MDSVEHVRSYLAQFGASDRVIEFTVSSATVELAAQALSCEPGRIAKTLSFMAGDRPIFLVAAGDRRIDNGKYKHTFGNKARMMTAEELEGLTGLHFGGVCPFDLPSPAEVWLDESLRAYDIVYPAAGNEASAVRLTPDELEAWSHACGWCDVTKAPALTV